MSNPYGNPNIAKYGERTRFGQKCGCSPVVASQRSKEKRYNNKCEVELLWRTFYELIQEDEYAEAVATIIKLAIDTRDLKAILLVLDLCMAIDRYERVNNMYGGSYAI